MNKWFDDPEQVCLRFWSGSEELVALLDMFYGRDFSREVAKTFIDAVAEEFGFESADEANAMWLRFISGEEDDED